MFVLKLVLSLIVTDTVFDVCIEIDVICDCKLFIDLSVTGFHHNVVFSAVSPDLGSNGFV